MQDLDIGFQQWWSAKDSRVRGRNPKDKADYIKMHGEIVRVGDEFSNGLLHPGDKGRKIE